MNIKSRTGRSTVFAAMLLAGIYQPVAGQGVAPSTQASESSPALNQHQAEASIANYNFRDGETLPELRIHYTTLGEPHKNAAGAVDNAILVLHWTNASSQALLTPEYKQALFAPGAPLDARRYFVVIPDDIGHGQSSKPSDALKAAFPHYGYSDMVELQHKLVVEALGIAHLRAIVGMSMGCMNAWQWSEDYPDSMDGIMPIACFPAAISGRNLLWRRILIHSIESDPSGGTAFAIARMMIDGVPNLQQEVTSREAADALLRGIQGQSAGQDANNVLYSFESSGDFNAEPGLSRIKSKVYALNFADDEFYRDSLQVLQNDIQQVRQGRVVIRPTSAGSAGHFTMSHPALWRDQVELFMKWLGGNYRENH
jgi:homoserine O-acetyltransferase